MNNQCSAINAQGGLLRLMIAKKIFFDSRARST